MSTLEDSNGEQPGQLSKSGRHSVESPQRFWMRIIAGGSITSLRNVGALLALVSVGGVASALVGGIWYLAIGDILGDTRTAATSAIAGALVIWIFVTVAAARVTMGGRGPSELANRGRQRGR